MIRLLFCTTLFTLFCTLAWAKKCPDTVSSVYENPDPLAALFVSRNLEHSFLGAKITNGALECYYGTGFVSLRYNLDDDGQGCRFLLPKKNPVGVRNSFDCLGSTEECQVICR